MRAYMDAVGHMSLACHTVEVGTGEKRKKKRPLKRRKGATADASNHSKLGGSTSPLILRIGRHGRLYIIALFQLALNFTGHHHPTTVPDCCAATLIKRIYNPPIAVHFIYRLRRLLSRSNPQRPNLFRVSENNKSLGHFSIFLARQ
jgi:hypothetical protein